MPSVPSARSNAGPVAALVLAAASAVPATAATFATSVAGYTQGAVAADRAGYNNSSTALGAPKPFIGPGAGAWALSPFSPEYQASEMVVIGPGGSLTLQFGAPVPVGVGREIGVVTNVGFMDEDYPNGATGSTPLTFAAAEFGAERSAVVEVAQAPGQFVSLGRVKFDKPANYFPGITTPSQNTAPADGVVADFGKPFTGELADFAGKSFTQGVALFGGSIGGTWFDVPTNLGLSEVNFVRFSDPLWQLADGTFAATRTSAYDGAAKPADLFVDSVSAVPEPGAVSLFAVAAVAAVVRRRPRAGAR